MYKSRLVLPLLVLVSQIAATGAEAQITVVDLTGAGVAQNQHAVGVNESGTVAGFIFEGTIMKAVAWQEGIMTRLGDLCEACASQAWAVNDAEVFAGVAHQADGTRRAVVWHGGTMTMLPPLPGDADSQAFDINNLGDVVGNSGSGSITKPVVWRGGVPEALGGPDPAVFASGANAINDAGEIVGIVYTAAEGGRPFIWRNGVLSVLASGIASGPALDINDHGVVVGLQLNFGPKATIWEDGVPTTLNPTGWSIASGINNAGQVVGYSGAGPATLVGTMWDDGVATILGGGVGNDINDAGQAVGTGTVLVGGLPFTHALLFQMETPASLLNQLLTMVTGIGPGRSLADKVTDARAAFDASDTATTCSTLNALLSEVRAQTGKKLTPAQAAAITALTARVRSLVGC